MLINPKTTPIVSQKHSEEDVDLENRIANFLYQQQVPLGRQFHTESKLGTVVVSGQLPSRHAKWLCLECCRRVAGVIKLIDNVEIQRKEKDPKTPLALQKKTRKSKSDANTQSEIRSLSLR